MKYRAAIIGCGKIGSEFADDPLIKGIFSHAGAYVSCNRTELIAVCDTDINKVEACRKRWNLQYAYTNYHEMIINEKPDIVSVCTPDHTHASIIYGLVKSSNLKAIISEKPLATNLNQAKKIVHEAFLKDKILAVNYTRRFDPEHQRVKKIIQEGKLGDIQTLNAYYSKGTLHNGTHIFDLARFLIGEIIAVRGFQNLFNHTNDPTINAFAIFQSGAFGFFHACDESAFTIFEVDIIGKKGRIKITESGHLIELYKVDEDPFYSGYKGLSKISLIEGMSDILLHVVEDVVESIENDRPPLCTGQDALIALRIAFSIIKSANNKGTLININLK